MLVLTRIAILLAFTFAISNAAEEKGKLQASPPRAIIVFDASQSMYAKLSEGKSSKLNLAKAILLNGLDSLPPDFEIGLLAFGHRGRKAPRGNRCGDIELLVPVGRKQVEEVKRQVSAISAKGTTPLCQALEQASEHLQAGTSPGSLILVSDGSEECGGDLLETARKIASRSDQLTVDILSLGQAEKNNALLEEIAKLTAGRLFDVQDAEAAEKAMRTIMDSLVARANLKVTAHDLWETEAITSKDLQWKLYGVEGTPQLVAEFQGASLNLQVTPGLYWVAATSKDQRYAMQVHVPQDKPVSTRLSLSQGEVELSPAELGTSDSWSFQIYRTWPGQDHDKHFVSKSNMLGSQVIKLSQGHYRLEYQSENSSAKHTRTFYAEAERRHVYKIAFQKKSDDVKL